MAKDIYHNLVKEALENEGWTITQDPFNLYYGGGLKKIAADLGAEKWIVAEKDLQKIVVEVKSFSQVSLINEFHHTVGQIEFYSFLLQKQAPERVLYLAMPKYAYDELTIEEEIREFMQLHNIRFILFDIQAQNITQWIR